MKEMDTHQIRDKAYKERIQDTLKKIQEVREQNSFIAYKQEEPLLDELEKLYKENEEAYLRHYLGNRHALDELGKAISRDEKRIHQQHFLNLHALMTQVSELLEVHDYSINQKAAGKLAELKDQFEKYQKQFGSWKSELEQFRMSLKEIMGKVWSEDYAEYKQYYQQKKGLIYGKDLPQGPLKPSEGFWAAGLNRRRVDMDRVRQLAGNNKKLLHELDQIDGAFYAYSDFEKIEKTIKDQRWMGRAMLVAAAVWGLVGLGVIAMQFPAWFVGFQDKKAWEDALSTNTYEGFQEYKQAYPEGKFKDSVEVAILDLGEAKIPEIVLAGGRKASYEGELEEGQPQGEGKATFANGDIYEGDWELGSLSGKGTYNWTDGDIYVGDWDGNERHGQGRQTYADGSIYEGSWDKGVWQGRGKLTDAKGVYNGNWIEGKRTGKGTQKYKGGGEYVGKWEEDQRDGEGEMLYANGARYRGMWYNDRREGEGKMWWNNGKFYDGSWSGDKKDGGGRLLWTDGSEFRGEWREDLINGRGFFKDRFRSISEGYWREDSTGISFYDRNSILIKKGVFRDGIFMQK